jgi:hypothetical protein
MPLPWPTISNVGGEIPNEQRKAITALLDQVGDNVLALLAPLGLPRSASPLFRPWNLVVVLDAQMINAYFAPLTGGTANIQWIDRSTMNVSPQVAFGWIRDGMGLDVSFTISFPRAVLQGSPATAAIAAATAAHLAEVERDNRLRKLGDLAGVTYLEQHLQSFLTDYPDPDRHVFLMMRFTDTPQFKSIHETISTAVTERGFEAIRADDRDYTGGLWTNVELCMIGCKYGIAVFEHIEEQDFNPNVSLELGYMLGRNRRCLLLEEERLIVLHADVIHKLYKPFDMFDIPTTVRTQVLRWIDVDLGARPPY